MMAVLGLGYGLTYAAIPGIIVRAVPERETGIGDRLLPGGPLHRLLDRQRPGGLGARLRRRPAGSQLPDLAGYTTVIWIGIAICVAAAVLAWVAAGRTPGGARARPRRAAPRGGGRRAGERRPPRRATDRLIAPGRSSPRYRRRTATLTDDSRMRRWRMATPSTDREPTRARRLPPRLRRAAGAAAAPRQPARADADRHGRGRADPLRPRRNRLVRQRRRRRPAPSRSGSGSPGRCWRG